MQACGLERTVTEGADSVNQTRRCAALAVWKIMTDHVLVTDDGAVRTVRMNRPDKKNALTCAMYDAMARSDRDRAAATSPSAAC